MTMRSMADSQPMVQKIRIRCRIKELQEEQTQVLKQIAALKKAKWYQLRKHLRRWWLKRGLADLERLVTEYRGDLLEMGDSQTKKEFFHDKHGKKWVLNK